MPNPLPLGQYELNPGTFTFGSRTPYSVPNSYLVSTFGEEEGEIDTYDESLLLEDGISFGEDIMSGMSLVFQINIRNRKGQSVERELGDIKRAWKPESIRRQPGAVQTLRMNKFGNTRIVYGRGREFMPTYGSISQGWCPIDAKFRCVDNCYYDNEVDTERIGLTTTPTAGFSSPFTSPIIVSQYTEAMGVIDIGGDLPTWPLIRIQGPVSKPVIQFTQGWKIGFNVSLNFAQYITVDPRPWSRGSFGLGADITNPINVSGRYLSDSVIWRDMKLEPGRHFATYSGVDPTKTSYADIYWRTAWSAP